MINKWVEGCECDMCTAARGELPKMKKLKLDYGLVQPFDPFGTSIGSLKPEKMPWDRDDAGICTDQYYQSRGITDLPESRIETQKAKGFNALIYSAVTEGLKTISAEPDNKTWLLPYNCLPPKFPNKTRYFARPCPVTPRHGFVESREVKSPEEAIAVFAEARKEDPKAEVIVTPMLTGKFSGVATNAGVTWGFGNDGVTSGGKGVTFLLPTPFTSAEKWKEHASRKLNADVSRSIKQIPYIELVEHKNDVVAVQFRDGPQQPTTVDFIPQQVKVKEILYPGSDLLAWEKLLKEASKQEGVVIDMHGMALSSHWAVHGIELGIPVVTSKRPKVGDVLEPSVLRLPVLKKKQLVEIKRLIYAYVKAEYVPGADKENYKYFDARKAITTAIAAVHSMSHWDGAPHLLEMRAVAIVTLLRFLSAATMGEQRHWGVAGPGQSRRGSRKASTKVPKTKYDYDGDGRTRIYNYVLKGMSLKGMYKYFQSTYRDFSTFGWDGQTTRNPENAGFGGPKWAGVSKSGIALTHAVERFLKNPTVLKWRDVTLAANTAVNSAHNNGKALNKWMNSDSMYRIGQAPALGFMNDFAARITLGLPTKGAI